MYVDDLVENFIEALRKQTTHPAEPIETPYNKSIRITAEEMELNYLHTWQMVCGVCNRLDLIDKATTKSWRARFSPLDKWFQSNRPYVSWDNDQSCIRIDEDARSSGHPTPRASRSIPELKPPWLGHDVGTKPIREGN
jgi:hypothetical protein